MEINILIEQQLEENLDRSWFSTVVERVLTAQNIYEEVELGLLITGQDRIHKLNKAYREVDKPTDVLAFPMTSTAIIGFEHEDDFITPPDGIKHLGEVIISYPQAQLQAKENKQLLFKELAALVIHGVLHLLGYDHMNDKESIEMKERESLIIKDMKDLIK